MWLSSESQICAYLHYSRPVRTYRIHEVNIITAKFTWSQSYLQDRAAVVVITWMFTSNHGKDSVYYNHRILKIKRIQPHWSWQWRQQSDQFYNKKERVTIFRRFQVIQSNRSHSRMAKVTESVICGTHLDISEYKEWFDAILSNSEEKIQHILGSAQGCVIIIL